MNRSSLTLVLSAALILGMSTLPAAAQRRGHGGGRPSSTGLEHAEMRANPHGQRGIENAESKQARKADSDHDRDDKKKHKDKDKKDHKKAKKHHKKS